jgi:glyoxylase-like metal-dependent hydrolase (beta-lactamase superfamily II)
MNPIIEHSDNILQVKVPLPFPLRWVNSYLIRGAGGFTLIDPGLHTQEAEQLWEAVLRERGIRFSAIERIVLTHHHPDHYGMAGWFQQRAGVPVLLSEKGYEQAQLLWGTSQPMTEPLVRLFREHGMDENTCLQMVEHMNGFVPQVSPQPSVTFLREGEKIRLGEREYTAIHTPGHALGHMCFYDEHEQILFCGDHVLPQISPNVSYMPDVEQNPLGSYIESLKEAAALPVRKAYPGHREPFAAYNERAAELIRHHEERLDEMLEHLRTPQTAYAVCRAVFGDRLTIHQLRFALAETIAHLVYLEAEGRAVRQSGDTGPTQYFWKAC